MTSPQTGEVIAIVGGRQASFDGFNRALDARRPIGSLAKPMVYLAALETGQYYAGVLPSRTNPSSSSCRMATRGAGQLHQGGERSRAAGPRADAVAQPRDGQPRSRRSASNASRRPTCSSVSKRAAECYPVDAARRGEPDPARSRADVQHARERRVPLAAARRARSAGRAEQAAQGAGARGRAGRGRGCRLRARSHADRGDESRHRSPGAQGSLRRTWSSPARPVPRTTTATAGSRDSRARTCSSCGSATTTTARPDSRARPARWLHGRD